MCQKLGHLGWDLDPGPIPSPMKIGRRPTAEQGVWWAETIISLNARCLCGLLRGAASYRIF